MERTQACPVCGAGLENGATAAPPPTHEIPDEAKENVDVAREMPGVLEGAAASDPVELLAEEARRDANRSALLIRWGSALALGAVVVTAVIGGISGAPMPSTPPEDEIAATMAAASRLVHDYHDELGSIPTPEIWERSARTGDSRFRDPWGEVFRYAPVDGGFRLATLGADGEPGGTGAASDFEKLFEIGNVGSEAPDVE